MIVRRNKAAEQAEARQALWRLMTVRHRAAGYLRLDVPSMLCTPAMADHLRRGLLACDGVYRVNLFGGSGKLSIRWTEDVCSLADVVRCLADLVQVPDGGAAVSAPAAVQALVPADAKPGLMQRLRMAGPVARWRDRIADWRAKAQVMSQIIAIKTGKQSPLPFDAKDWGIHFINDLVVFYLIRVHWDRILRQWLPAPWTYRYQWMSVIYLTFLLVRFRKASMNKSKP